MSRWLKRVWKALKGFAVTYGFFTSEFFKAVLVPAVSTVVAVMLAAIDSWPSTAMYLAAIFTFAATATGLLRFDEWRQRRRVEDKLIFSGPYVGINKSEDGKSISAAQIGALLQNTATFPISYKVTRIRTSADNTIPSSGTLNTYDAVVQAGTVSIFRDLPIDCKVPKAAMEGTLEIELLYGRPGREKYPILQNITLSLRYDPMTGVFQYPWLYSSKENIVLGTRHAPFNSR